jgi:seryl-tRNA synthetase
VVTGIDQNEQTALDGLLVNEDYPEAAAAVRALATQARDKEAENRSLVAEARRATDAMEAAEADRDRLQADREKMHERIMAMHRACDKAEADRDKLAEQGRIAAKRYGEEATRRMEAEADRDRYRDALEQIVACDFRGNMPREQSIARAALATPDTPPDYQARMFDGIAAKDTPAPTDQGQP